MLCWFHRFRFNQECTLEAFSASVVASHTKHSSHMFFFTLLVSVEQAHVTFAAAPEYIVLCTKFDTGIDSILNLYDSASHNIEVGVSRSTVHITLVAEYVGSRPKQLDACFLHLLFQISYDSFQVSFVFFYRVAFRNKVYIVEAEVREAKFSHDFEASVSFLLSDGKSVGTFAPRESLSTATELVGTVGTECMPPAHGEAQPFFHRLAHDYFFSVIIVKCQWIL